MSAQGAATDLSWERTRLFMRRPWLDNLPTGRELPDDYSVRPYQPVELAHLTQLLQRAFPEMEWSEVRTRERLLEDPTVVATYVVAHGDNLAATATVRVMPQEYPGSGFVHLVGTDPNEQGKGLGTLISLRVLRHFKEVGLRDAVLETQTFRIAAIRTYLRLGFVPEYRFGDPDEQLRWARLLPGVVR